MVFPELGGEGDPVIMDLLLLTQVQIFEDKKLFAIAIEIERTLIMVTIPLPPIIIITLHKIINHQLQANHTIYDYGSFGFWGAVLAGGTTMLADGYRFGLFFSFLCHHHCQKHQNDHA